jgi:hypothetical protein
LSKCREFGSDGAGIAILANADCSLRALMRLSRRITVTWRRADELAVLLARAITRRSSSSPLVFGCPRRRAA